MTDEKQPDQAQAVPTQPKLLDGILGTPATKTQSETTFLELSSQGGALVEKLRKAIKDARGKRLKQAAVDAGVKKLIKKYPNIAIQHLAKLLGCSVGAVAKAPAWKNEMVLRRKAKTGPLDEVVLDNVADPRAADPRDEALARLNEEQWQDQLTDEGRRRVKRRL